MELRWSEMGSGWILMGNSAETRERYCISTNKLNLFV